MHPYVKHLHKNDSLFPGGKKMRQRPNEGGNDADIRASTPAVRVKKGHSCFLQESSGFQARRGSPRRNQSAIRSDERGKTLNQAEDVYGTTSLGNSLKTDCPINMLKAWLSALLSSVLRLALGWKTHHRDWNTLKIELLWFDVSSICREAYEQGSVVEI